MERKTGANTNREQDTYAVSAQRERQAGRQAQASARGDAMGELYCEVCGLERYGKDTCRECGASKAQRKTAATEDGDRFPMDLRDARKWTGKK